MRPLPPVAHVDVGGLRIAYRRVGAGPPVVLLHGGLGDGREWRAQLEDLADAFTVVAWDAPGCGASSDPPASFRLHDYADCVAALVDALGLERPHVVGLSFGGGLALEVFGRHPTLPRTLVLASAYAGWRGSLGAEVAEQRLRRALREIESPPEEVVNAYLPDLFAKQPSDDVVAEVATMMSEFRPAGIRPAAHAYAEADLRDVLPRVSVPTLLLYGDADERCPPSVSQDLHAQIPGSRLVVIPGVGHQINIEAPERFNAELRRFFATTG